MEDQRSSATIVSKIGAGLSLAALACELWLAVETDRDFTLADPWHSTSMGLALAGILAGILALARHEPRRLAFLALTVGVCVVFPLVMSLMIEILVMLIW